MQSTPQADILRDLVAHLRAANLPQSPRVRPALLVGYSRDALAETTITCVMGTPESSRLSRSSISVAFIVEVVLQRALPTETVETPDVVQDLDWPSIEAMLECQRQLMLALYRFSRVEKVEPKASGDQDHARQGVWTSAFVVTIQGEYEAL